MKNKLLTTIILASLGFSGTSFAWWGNNNPMDSFFGDNPMDTFFGNNNRYRNYGNNYRYGNNGYYRHNYRQNDRGHYNSKGKSRADADIDLNMDLDMKFRMKMDNDFWGNSHYAGQGNGRHNYQNRNNWKVNSSNHQYNVYAPYPSAGTENRAVNSQRLKPKKSYEYYVRKMQQQQREQKR